MILHYTSAEKPWIYSNTWKSGLWYSYYCCLPESVRKQFPLDRKVKLNPHQAIGGEVTNIYDEKLVSIIVPVYNTSIYLYKCLHSLLSQSHLNIEIICIDGGSSDNCADIIQKFVQQDSRIKYHRMNCNSVGQARNKGIELAAGKYIAFVDSDDYVEKNMIKDLLTAAESKDSDVVCFPCSRYNVYNEKSIPGEFYLEKQFLGKVPVFSADEIPEKIFRLSDHYSFSRLYSAAFIQKHQLRFSETEYFDDIRFSFLTMALAERITYIGKPVYCHLNRRGSRGIKKWVNANVLMDALLDTYQKFAELGIDKKITAGFIYQADRVIYNYFRNAPYQIFRDVILEKLQQESFCFLLDGSCIPEESPKGYQDDFTKIKETFLGAIDRKKKLEQCSNSPEERCLKVHPKLEQCRISVIMPVYQCADYLTETMDSLISQSMRDFEIICVDDGSVDNSLSILLQYAEKDDRISVFTQNHSGCGDARNVGIQNSVGDYFYFMDSDDILKPDAFKIMLDAAEGQDLDALYFDADWFYDENCTDHERLFKRFYHRSYKYPRCTTGERLYAAFSENWEYIVVGWMALFKRSLIMDNDIRFCTKIVHSDNIFAYQGIILADRAGYIDKALYKRRIHPGSIMTSHDNLQSAYSYFVVATELQKYHDQYNKRLKADSNAWSLYRISLAFQSSMSDFRKCSDFESAGVYASADYNPFKTLIADPIWKEKENKKSIENGKKREKDKEAAFNKNLKEQQTELAAVRQALDSAGYKNQETEKQLKAAETELKEIKATRGYRILLKLRKIYCYLFKK